MRTILITSVIILNLTSSAMATGLYDPMARNNRYQPPVYQPPVYQAPTYDGYGYQNDTRQRPQNNYNNRQDSNTRSKNKYPGYNLGTPLGQFGP